MLNITANADLRNYSTMRLGGTAQYLCSVTSRQEVAEAIDWAIANQAPPIMVGGGSNIIWRDEGFNGLVIVNAIDGYEDYAEDDENHYITAGAGENWDSFVARTVQAGLTGIEALSLVPGTVGGTPVQNVGAYGQDVSQTIVSVQAYDLHTRSFLTIPAADCQFGYRSSRFNGEDRGRFLITNVTFHLMKGNLQPPFYGALERYFTENNITNPDPMAVRTAVIAIRSSKLPDPATVANCGSFFGNPFVDRDVFLGLQLQYPEMPHWPTDDPNQIKLSAAWLLEQSGYKDFHDSTTGMGTWPSQPLVLVNEAAKTTADLVTFKQQVVTTVRNRFGVELRQEPELLP